MVSMPGVFDIKWLFKNNAYHIKEGLNFLVYSDGI